MARGGRAARRGGRRRRRVVDGHAPHRRREPTGARAGRPRRRVGAYCPGGLGRTGRVVGAGESGARRGGPAAPDPRRSAQHAGASAAAAARRALGSPGRPAGAWRKRGRADHLRVPRVGQRARRPRLAEESPAARARRDHRHLAGGAAVLLGRQPIGADAVVVEAVYPDIRTSLENRVRIRHGPLAPVLAPLLVVQLRPRLGVESNDLRPITGIAGLGAPVLVVAGQLDRHTTLAESEALFVAAAAPKELWVVAGAHHEDFLAKDPDGYRERVIGFLRRHLLL